MLLHAYLNAFSFFIHRNTTKTERLQIVSQLESAETTVEKATATNDVIHDIYTCTLYIYNIYTCIYI